MSEPYLAEVKIFGFNFPPRGWAFCDGQILPINQNQSLYSLLGTTYGGDGRTSFALPDLRGRVPVHFGAGFSLGNKGGEQTHTLATNEMPAHTHPFNGSTSPGDTNLVTNNVLAGVGAALYHTATNLTQLAASAISDTGGGQSHNNMQPFNTLSFCIALEGTFPPRN